MLYVLFTSGSTGEPKGVSISHKSVIDYIFWVSKTFDVGSDEILVNQAPFYFDNSILDIFTTVRCGATLHLLSTFEFAFPAKVVEYLKTHGVTMIFWVPKYMIPKIFIRLDKFALNANGKIDRNALDDKL
ncbi:AMP-binding protein [Campylobacter devanensis]|uniref:AMP-binding protein n=1 Tax=Campylobacter devanensis TaxID=3161138 RepID=UPI0015D6E878|nr:AMP-binding protein [Campylobacter sp. P0209]